MIRWVHAWIVAAAVAGAPCAAAAQDAPEQRALYLAFDEQGRVTLSARNVATRDILAEWARQCGCFIVNADRLDSTPSTVPLQFTNASQGEVLRSLLRQTAGYVLTPRRPGSTSPSDYETIYVVAARAPAPSYSPVTSLAPPVAAPIVSVGSPDDEIPPVVPIAADPGPDPAPTVPEPESVPQPQPVTPPPAGGFVVPPVQSIPAPATPPPGTAPTPAPVPGGVTPVPNTQP